MNRLRAWLNLVLGPSVLSYSDERVLQRFRTIQEFYGYQALSHWPGYVEAANTADELTEGMGYRLYE
jgi:hypothetical protein